MQACILANHFSPSPLPPPLPSKEWSKKKKKISRKKTQKKPIKSIYNLILFTHTHTYKMIRAYCRWFYIFLSKNGERDRKKELWSKGKKRGLNSLGYFNIGFVHSRVVVGGGGDGGRSRYFFFSSTRFTTNTIHSPTQYRHTHTHTSL